MAFRKAPKAQGRQKVQARSWRPDQDLVWFFPSSSGPITFLFLSPAEQPHLIKLFPLLPAAPNIATRGWFALTSGSPWGLHQAPPWNPRPRPQMTTPIKRLLPPRRARLPDPAQCRLAVPLVRLAYPPGELLPSSVLPPARQVSWELFPVATSTQTPLRGREGRKAQSGSSPVGRLEWGRCPRLRPRRGRAGRGAGWRK